MAEEGGVTVCVRLRPLIAREHEDLDEKGQVSWKSEDCTVSQIDGTRSFVFDRVFHSNNSTKEVYQGVTAPIIKSAVQGYNGTIFAYGQTASGKTYTILGTKDGPGILSLAINDVFNTICRIPDREFLLRISYMEIHNETIQDLLCSNIRKKKSLVVREDINRTIYVEDLNEEVVVSPEEVMSWLKKGEKNRHYGETKMNERSSRSHTIFRMIIESKEKHTSGSSYEGAVMVSHLNFVDLAGSERASQTGAEGIRLKEGCNINRSLFILGQVIKKLCDDQSGGFINYRDSKLTRILQNSLGGNAKTVIICTITPASLEETLSTLQFASTAKKMKNTPKVNEVLDDDALLKRYRNEIEDLKRQLEEVSSRSHTKDQLAQLLEEKNSVQKEQQDRIRALTEMLVTSSSFLRERELKAKKKRRVTWAPGAVSQDGGMPFLEDFPGRAKRFKSSLSCVTEMEESVSSEFSEYDDQCMTASVIIPEEEWIPGSEINFTSKDFAESVQLCQSLLEERDNAVTEQQSIKAKLDSVCLEKEQLSYEVTELREKISTHEFVALEKRASEEQEMQLMHEITNLKAIISNAEIYNQDLQQEIDSKYMRCKEQEERITALEEQNKKLKSLVEEFKKDKNDTTILVQTPRKNRDEVQELKQSLRDAEAVALDAKKESSFLQSENLILKEKMNQLSETYNQMEKDLGNYKTQLEAGKVTYKKMQSDLQKELQYYLQENAKLTSPVEVNNSKDLLPYMELEGKMEDLKNELNKALEENVSLKEKLTGLSEANSGSDLEFLHKEIVEKNETIALLMSEKEMLLSQVSEKERMVHEATQALASKMDLANDEMIRGNTVASEELRQSCDRWEQKSLVVAEEDKSMKTQIDSCSNGSLNTSISYNTQEQSSKNEELQEKDLEQEELLTLKEQLDEAHEKLSEMEELKDQLKVWESKMEAEEAQKLDMIERLQEDKGKIRALTQERSDFKQKQEALEKERDQLKEDIQDTVSMNIEAQEGLRNAQNSLKQCQKRIKELEETIAEKEKKISRVKETLEITADDQKQQILQILQILKLTGDLKDVSVNKTQNEEDTNQIVLEVNNELQRIKEQIATLQQEKVALQHQMEDLEKEKNLYLESNQMNIEAQEGFRDAQNSLKQCQKHIKELEETIAEKDKQISRVKETLEITTDDQKQQILQILQILKLTGDLKDVSVNKTQNEEDTNQIVLEVNNELQRIKEQIATLQQEKVALQHQMEDLEKEKNLYLESNQMNIEAQEGFRDAQNSLKQCQKHIKELEETIAEKDKQISRVKETLEITTDDQKQQILQILQILKLTGDLKDVSVNKTQNEEDTNQIVLEVNNELQRIKEQIATLQQEKVALQHQMEDLEKEKNRYLESNQMNIEAQEGFRDAQNSLKQCQKHIKELEETIAEKDKQISRVKETLEITTDDQKQQILQILQILKLTGDLKDVSVNKTQNEEDTNQIVLEVNNELQRIKEQIATLQQEKVALQHQMEDLEKEKNLYLESNQMLQTKSFDLQQLLQTNQNVENFDDAEQLKISLESQVEVLQKENAELVQKLHNTEEDIKYIGQEKERLRTELEVLQAEKDTMTQTVHHLEELVPTNLELQEQLREANNSLGEYKEMVEELKGKTIAIDSQTSKIDEELKQKAEDTQLELEKLLAYVKLQEDEVNTQKNLVLEKQQMFQKLEEEFKEETKKLKEKIQHLENNSLELQELLCLKEEDSQQNVENMKDAKQLESISESQMEALQREKTELVQKLQSTEENIRYISQEKEHLRTEMEVLQTQKDNMIQTVHHLSENIDRLIPVNLKLQQELSEANNSLREHKEMVKELKEKIVTTDLQTLKIHEELKKKSEHSQLELEKLLVYVQSQEDEVNTQKNLVLEKQQMFQKYEEKIKEETNHLKEKIIKSNEEVSSLTEEKKQLTAELREQEKCVQQLLKEKALLQKERDDLQQVMQNIGEETQSQLQETLSENAAKITKLKEEANSLTEEKKQLTAELRETEICVQQLLKEKALLQKERDDLQQVMQNIGEETQSQLQETLSENAAKITKLKEEANSLTEEKKQLTAELRETEICVQQLLKEKALLQKERDDLQQVMQNIGEETQSQLQETLSENAEKITKLKEEANSLTEEKKQLTAELRETEKCVQQLLKEKALLQKERDDLQQVMQNIGEETQSQLQETLSENATKITKLNEEANNLTEEKKQLTAEVREKEKCVQQLLKEKALLQKERDDLQQVMQNIREETPSQFQETLSENAGKDSEMNGKRKMQDCFDILEGKIFKIMEALKKFPELEKTSEYFIKISLQIKNQFDSKKALIAKWLPDISPQEANKIKRLQIENERISNHLYSLLNQLQYFFACLCDKRKEYYTNISKYTRELLDERRNQHALLMQIQELGKPPLEQQGTGSQQSGVSELIQSLDGLTQQISKEVSEMEEELGSTEVMLQELELENIEMERYLERCSDHFDLNGFEATIKQNNEKFRSINQFLQPKAQPYFQARSAQEAINTNYCRDIDATLKACRAETKQLILQLDVLKKEKKSCGVPNMTLEEENHKLKAAEQDIKNLQLKIQELERIIKEGEKNLQEKEKTITTLEMKFKVRASRTEVVRLQTALEEKENSLRNALSERETLKAQVDKGVGLYKEEIEDLRTQLAKADMARMKQSKLFDREMANAKALAEHREEQLRKLKEELRKAQQEQDVTVISQKDLPQTFLPITCGGGSGIVQNTHMLVLKSEHAKLEKEHAQLKKEHELLLTNEHLLKEDIKKWKERAMKRRERALGDTAEEHKIKSPRKAPDSSLLALPASPCKERSMQPILPLDTPQLMPLNSQSNFFDNSCLGITANTTSGRTESEENNFKQWLSSEDKGDVSNCKTQ